MIGLEGLAFLLLGAAIPAEAPAQASFAPLPVTSELDEFETVTDDELAGHRGGFTWQGVDVNLGAEIRTYLDGALVLQTNVSWTAAGASMTQLVSGSLTPADAAQLQAGILTSGGITMRVGGESVFLANQGQTAILHRTDGALQNILVNRASNVTARQEVDAVLDLGNFSQFQSQLLDVRAGHTIGDMVGQGTLGGLGN